MSGHSKWAKIKRQKGANDAKKGDLFTKLAKNITLAAKEGGGDPDANFTLRLAVDKAKAANMPSNNIQRAIEKATGGTDQDSIVRVSYEALGPEGTSVIIDCQTNNTNRTVSELRNIIESNGGKFASTGSVSWKFLEKGLINIRSGKLVESQKYGEEAKVVEVDPEEVMLEILEFDGIEDVEITETDWNKTLDIITSKENFNKVLKNIESNKFSVISAELIKVASDKTEVDQNAYDKIQKFVEVLEEHDDVDSVWLDI